MTKKLTALLATILLSLATPAGAATVIKFATLAPEGTSWVNLVREMNAELEKTTGGEVKLKIYPGGVMGDEPVVLQKFRAGQLHAAALTGIGLGQIESAERVLELPFLFSSYEEIDYVVPKVTPDLEAMFRKHGYVVLGWTETGLVNFFSKKPITSLKSFEDVKMWAWTADPMVKTVFKEFNITPVALELPDVPMSLDTGIITAAYGTPVAALALQWSPRIDFITRQNMAFSSGAIVITAKAFDKLSKDHQKTLTDLGRKYSRKITESIRKENEEALAVFAQQGKKFVDFDAKEWGQVQDKARTIRKGLAGTLFSKDLHNQVIKLRNEFRGRELDNLKKSGKADTAKETQFADSKKDLI